VLESPRGLLSSACSAGRRTVRQSESSRRRPGRVPAFTRACRGPRDSDSAAPRSSASGLRATTVRPGWHGPLLGRSGTGGSSSVDRLRRSAPPRGAILLPFLKMA
jgi:hypothetical protein